MGDQESPQWKTKILKRAERVFTQFVFNQKEPVQTD